MKLLQGHNSKETAYVIDDYPYGFKLRTKIRYWVESVKSKGDRFCSQTLNPKTNNWNKEKKSTYSDIILLKLEDNGYIGFIEYSVVYTEQKDLDSFLEKVKKDSIELNTLQKEQIIVAKAILKTRDNITCSVVETTSWTKEEIEAHKIKEDETKKQLKQIFAYNLIKEKEVKQ